MYCPKCGAHYKNEFAEACECHVELVDEMPEDEMPEDERVRTGPPLEAEQLDGDSVVIMETSDQTEILLAKSILASAEIPFLVQGEGIRNLFGLGGLTPVNPISGPILLRVEVGKAEEAKALLEARDESGDVPEED